MIDVKKKKTDKCEWDGKKKPVYRLSIQGQQGEYRLCKVCMVKFIDMQLERAGLVETDDPAVPN